MNLESLQVAKKIEEDINKAKEKLEQLEQLRLTGNLMVRTVKETNDLILQLSLDEKRIILDALVGTTQTFINKKLDDLDQL